MRIDPRTFTLDKLERDALLGALVLRIDGLSRTIARKKASRYTDLLRDELDRLEMDQARCLDLLSAFRDPPVTMAQRLAPGCTCGASPESGRCRCD